MDLNDSVREKITQAIYAGDKIEAIKLYRQATGQGLARAKSFIEALTERLRETHPDRIPAPNSGCGATLLLFTLLPCSLLTLLLI